MKTLRRSKGIIVCAAISIALLVQTAGTGRTSRAGERWAAAEGLWPWSFPRDHGVHRAFRTEWWYFTGSLRSLSSDYSGGYQLTFFRTGLMEQPAIPGNPWSVRDLYLAHFSITDALNGRFKWTERLSRTGPGLAGALDDTLEVWLHDWKAVQEGENILLKARSGEMALDLTLVPHKPPIKHGEEGLSLKGPGPGQASWYYSMTSLNTKGIISPPGGTAMEVEGQSWFDHEFGSNLLAEDQEGWDWFGLHLSNGSEIMIYMLRKTDGSLEPVSSGTFIGPDGSATHLALSDLSVQSTGSWKSHTTGGTYPSGWRITIPGEEIDIGITPVLKDQELVTEATAGITYWEGAVTLKGLAGGENVTGGGYVELTGYAGSMGGIF
jgi:predicted secreted hydrolase